MKEFQAWANAARDRCTVLLMDGQQARLIAVRKNSRSVKIKLGFRHYNVWIEDVALVKLNGVWTLLPPWKAAPLPPDNAPQPRSLKADPSQNWLKVEHNPKVLHPSFLPPASSPPHPTTSTSPAPASTDSGSE